uniref:histamine N-methyltransferase-like isoform X2 n=1 Tax=Doryrhamphus excisus TaxID=161450 RepID=UPI0025AE0860|nr:histamine N-methyltransferase-like isoform X2 [Doryrhamphus excisus]XP_057937133.1 histamine N-methyltransferase-like isoform X2 [Doryrhamphus excisus]XP_057937134.1 histamine N-methyltransferase-like isoform X2 [Doryrhamphus excisus]
MTIAGTRRPSIFFWSAPRNISVCRISSTKSCQTYWPASEMESPILISSELGAVMCTVLMTAGHIDLEMFSELRLKHPGVTVDYQVVEPSSQQLHSYKVLLAQKSDLDYITFNWNKMTSAEFEEQWKSKQTTKKADFIHMIQMLYYVKDVDATIRFFQSLLDKNGKLLIILVSGESGWGKLWKTFSPQLCMCEISQCVTTADVKSFLESEKLKYKSYALPSQMDITECFTEGDEKGELLLDFLTETNRFSRTASPQLKADVLKLLRDPCCSVESNGRVIFNNTLEVIIVDATI